MSENEETVTHTELAGIHVLTWQEGGIQIRADRLSAHTERVTAELAISSTDAGPIHWGRLNLLSTGAKKALVSQLTDRVSTVDWYATVEELCSRVIARVRAGAPAVKLGDQAFDASMAAFRVIPILPEMQPTIIYSSGGSGKTLLAQYLAALVTLPISAAGLDVEPGGVLFLDYETSTEEAAANMRRIHRGLDIEAHSNVHYRRCSQPLTADIEAIQAIVSQKEIDLVIIDSFGFAAPSGEGGMEKGESAVEYFRALRSLECTTLTLDHVAKEGQNGSRSQGVAGPYGSVYKYNAARKCWRLQKSGDSPEDCLDISLTCTKSNLGRLDQPIGLRFKFADDEIRASRLDIRNTDLSEGLGLRQRVYDALLSGARSVDDLAEELESTPKAILPILWRSKNALNQRIFLKINSDWGLAATHD